MLNSLKKILLFSSVKSKKLIETMADDESTCTKIKSSAILESRLVDSFLTENDQIRFWILNLYNGDTSGKILSSVFAYNSSGINWKSKGLPVLPFIEFAINEQKYINKYKADKEPMEHFLDCLDSIERILVKMKNDSLDVESKIKYRGALETLSYFSKVNKPFDALFPDMDSNKIYGIEKDAEGNHLLMKYEIRECGVWPNYFKVLDDEQETGKSDE